MIAASYGISIFPEKFNIYFAFLFQRSFIHAPHIFIPNYLKGFHTWRRKGWISETDWAEMSNSLSINPDS